MTPYEEKRMLSLFEDVIRFQERCPTDSALLKRGGLAESHRRDTRDRGYVNSPALARAGKIRLWVFGKNYRVVELLVGKSKGKTTLPPLTYKPWKMIGPVPTSGEQPAYGWYCEHIKDRR